MNNLGNIKFISNDPYKSRREFIKKKGDRPETEWEDHIKEIEPLPLHTQEFPILFFLAAKSARYLLQFYAKNAVRRFSCFDTCYLQIRGTISAPPPPQLAFKTFPEKIHLIQESYVCHNRHNKKQYTHDVLRQESFNNSVLGLGLRTSCSGLVK